MGASCAKEGAEGSAVASGSPLAPHLSADTLRGWNVFCSFSSFILTKPQAAFAVNSSS